MVPTVPLGKEIPPEACGKPKSIHAMSAKKLVLVCPLFNPSSQVFHVLLFFSYIDTMLL